MKDKVYRRPSQIVDFAFNDSVAAVFPDMIRRSVPGYELIIPMTGLIAAEHLPTGGLVYDLGCSLGASSAAVLDQAPSADVKVIAVDSSPAMIEHATAHFDDPRIDLRCADLLETSVLGADVIILNFVVQFLAPEQRLNFFKRLRAEMNPSGVIIVSEKISQPDDGSPLAFPSLHLQWKRANGYSDLEVSQKRQALENVMRIDDEATHFERFQKAGFGHVRQWFRCLNWASYLVFATQDTLR